MPRFTPQTTESIFAQLLARVVVLGGLTDITDSSVIKHILMAFARALDEGYYQAAQILTAFSINTASGADLDARAQDIQPGLLQRLPATSATTTLIFTRNVAAGDLTIPAGVTVSTASGVSFVTTEDGLITSDSTPQLSSSSIGMDSAPVTAMAQTAGVAGNVASGTLTLFGQKPQGVDAVVNLAPATLGADQESDDSFRARLQTYVNSLARSTLASLEACVLSAVDATTGARILFSSAVEDPDAQGHVYLYVDDGTGHAQTLATVSGELATQGLFGPPPNSAAGGEVYLTLQNNAIKTDSPITITSSVRGVLPASAYALAPGPGKLRFDPPLVQGEAITASYTCYTGIVSLAQKIVDGDPADRANYPGYRAAGTSVQVLTPVTVVPPVSAVLTVAAGYDVPTVYANTAQAILTAINSLPISGDVLLSSLYAAAKSVDGLANVIFTQPAQDVVILDNQIARTTIDNIVVS